MTRKKYLKKARNLIYQINQLSPNSKNIPDQRDNIPSFPYIPKSGKYAGQVINSYAQAWETVLECMKGTGVEGKI